MTEDRHEPGVHDLLPWYLNGTLSRGEKLEFEKHLPTCEGCREEMRMLQGLRAEMRDGGEEFLADHPSADDLVQAVLGGLDSDDIAVIRRHLALCPTCAEEARVLREPHTAATPAVRPAVPARASVWRMILPWAAAAVLAIGLMLQWLDDRRPAPPRSLHTFYVEAVDRSVAEVEFRVPRGASGFILILEADLGRSDRPVHLEIRREEEPPLFVAEAPGLLDRGLYCDRRQFDDGVYVAKAWIADQPEPSVFTYRFRIVTEAP